MLKHQSVDDLDEIQRHIWASLIEVKPDCGVSNRMDLEPEQRLGADLGLKSLDFVRFAGGLQRRLKAGPLRFQHLFVNADGTFSDDISIGRLREFLGEALSKK